jgi:hypothetical protein
MPVQVFGAGLTGGHIQYIDNLLVIFTISNQPFGVGHIWPFSF